MKALIRIFAIAFVVSLGLGYGIFGAWQIPVIFGAFLTICVALYIKGAR